MVAPELIIATFLAKLLSLAAWAAPAALDGRARAPVFPLSTILNLLILGGLVWWFLRLHGRRRNEEKIFRASYYDSETLAHLHTGQQRLAYRSDGQLRPLRRHRETWVAQFRVVRNAIARRNLKPVSALVAPDLLSRLEREHGSSPSKPFQKDFLVIRWAEPVDSWLDDNKEYVSVQFRGDEFDERWTFARDLGLSGYPPQERASWVVTDISPGERLGRAQA